MLGLANSLAGGAALSEAWQPTDLDNLALWLKNDTGVAVEQWDDSSGNDNHATQGSSGNQAAVSGGGLDFELDESDHYDLTAITMSENHNFLISFVVTLETIGAASCVLSGGTALFIDFQNNKKIRINCSSTTTSLEMVSSTFGTSAQFAITISRNDADTGTFAIYKDGTELSGTFANEANPLAISFDCLGARAGSGRFFDGIIHEVIVYDLGTSSHSSDDITNLNNYLTTKFGL